MHGERTIPPLVEENIADFNRFYIGDQIKRTDNMLYFQCLRCLPLQSLIWRYTPKIDASTSLSLSFYNPQYGTPCFYTVERKRAAFSSGAVRAETFPANARDAAESASAERRPRRWRTLCSSSLRIPSRVEPRSPSW